jgi:hypothetical protein
MRTFIFGAGASIHAGYPLASDFWSRLEAWARLTFGAESLFNNAIEIINARFDRSKPFELVLTDLDSRIDSLKGAIESECIQEKHSLILSRDALMEMIRQYFGSLRSQPAEIYRTFANEVLAEGETLITFNYDVALDRELARSGRWSPSNGYGFVTDRSLENSSCVLLKLHGSTNWHGEIFQGMTGFFQGSWTNLSLGQRPVIRKSELVYLGYENWSDPGDHGEAASVNALILPTARKRFFRQTSFGLEWKDFWDSLWRQAEDALKVSGEVYLIGYSVPEYDSRARQLLSKIGKTAWIKVCCGDATRAVIETLSALTECRVQPAGSVYFEEWIRQAAPVGEGRSFEQRCIIETTKNDATASSTD